MTGTTPISRCRPWQTGGLANHPKTGRGQENGKVGDVTPAGARTRGDTKTLAVAERGYATKVSRDNGTMVKDRVIWKVYRMEFSNGDQYIGITRREISRRLFAHHYLYNRVNKRVTENLKNKDVSMHIRVLSHHTNKARAMEREIEEIGKLTRPLNWNGLPPEKRERLKACYTGSPDLKYERQKAGSKKCYKCQDTLPVASFYADATRRSGLSSRCIRCNGATPEAAQANRDKRFRCRHCREWKDGAEYYRDASRSSGLMSSCKTCCGQRWREAYWAKKKGKKASEGYAIFREKVKSA